MLVFNFWCSTCGSRETPCHHWLEEQGNKHQKFVEAALIELNSDDRKRCCERIIALENVIISELDLVLERVNCNGKMLDEIWDYLHRPQSATLKLQIPKDGKLIRGIYRRTEEGWEIVPATILVGGAASSLFQEWSGPSGTGVVVPNAAPPAFTSSDPTIATVDPSTGVATGVAPGTATITGTDPTNPSALTASDTLTVNPVPPPPPPPPVSATLALTAN